MKKITLLFLIMIIFSCSSNDDSDNQIEEYNGNQSDLTGTWNLESAKYKGNDLTLDVCDIKENIIIDKDGNAVWEFSISGIDDPLFIDDPAKCNFTNDGFKITDMEGVYFKVDLNRFVTYKLTYDGKFLTRNKIQITKNYKGNYTVYMFIKE